MEIFQFVYFVTGMLIGGLVAKYQIGCGLQKHTRNPEKPKRGSQSVARKVLGRIQESGE